jgi:hypothetical protein
MKKTIKGLLTTTLLIVSTQSILNAKETIGVGFQSSGFSSNGLSVKVDLTDEYGVQAIGGFFGDVTNYSIRGLYTFQNKKNYNLYGYGSVGMWKIDYTFLDDESVVGYGAGAGVEYDLRALSPSFIPLFVNFELGIDVVKFDNDSYGGFTTGLGLHYKF